MTYTMNNLRLANASILYYLVSGMNFYGWSGITFRDDFPEDPQKIDSLPTIALSHTFTFLEPFQIGKGLKSRRHFDVIVYAQSDGVRDDLADDVATYLFNTQIDLKDYNSGFPPPFGASSEPSIIAKIDPEHIRMVPSIFMNKEHTAIKHIMTIGFDGIIYSDT